jgi:predicted extracellular nuclease
MKKLYTLLFVSFASLSFGQATDLYFSMYGEGSGSNKFLEIYNGTGSAVDLSNYSIELYANGAITATNTQAFAAGTMIASGDVYVLYATGSNTTIINASDLLSATCNFNGDDAVVLKKSGTVIDMIGSVGADPGTGWNVGSTSACSQGGSSASSTDQCKYSSCATANLPIGTGLSPDGSTLYVTMNQENAVQEFPSKSHLVKVKVLVCG